MKRLVLALAARSDLTAIARYSEREWGRAGETELQIVNLKSQQLDDVLKDLRDVQSKRFDLLDRLRRRATS